MCTVKMYYFRKITQGLCEIFERGVTPLNEVSEHFLHIWSQHEIRNLIICFIHIGHGPIFSGLAKSKHEKHPWTTPNQCCNIDSQQYFSNSTGFRARKINLTHIPSLRSKCNRGKKFKYFRKSGRSLWFSFSTEKITKQVKITFENWVVAFCLPFFCSEN